MNKNTTTQNFEKILNSIQTDLKVYKPKTKLFAKLARYDAGIPIEQKEMKIKFPHGVILEVISVETELGITDIKADGYKEMFNGAFFDFYLDKECNRKTTISEACFEIKPNRPAFGKIKSVSLGEINESVITNEQITELCSNTPVGEKFTDVLNQKLSFDEFKFFVNHLISNNDFNKYLDLIVRFSIYLDVAGENILFRIGQRDKKAEFDTLYTRRFEVGDKVRLNHRKILFKKNNNHKISMSPDYVSFIENNKDTLFTIGAYSERSGSFELKENPTWLFRPSDLLLCKD